MTMADGVCEVCRTRPPIGVACTSIPLSVAYCGECAAAGADPEIVFVCWIEDCNGNLSLFNPAILEQVTWKDGRFMTFKEWAEKYGAEVLVKERKRDTEDSKD